MDNWTSGMAYRTVGRDYRGLTGDMDHSRPDSGVSAMDTGTTVDRVRTAGTGHRLERTGC